MTRVHAEAVRNLSSAAAESKSYNDNTLDSGRLKWQTPIKNILIFMESVVTHSGRIRPDESRITSLQDSISGSEGFTLT